MYESEAKMPADASQYARGLRASGDGKIFVINLDHAVRIRTGEADAAAL